MALQPGDEVVGGWSREQLMRMDAHFVDAVERAIARGKEHTQRRAADMNALHFAEQQIALLRELATPLAPSQRSAFLKDVARRAIDEAIDVERDPDTLLN